jgi:hypothetical protein
VPQKPQNQRWASAPANLALPHQPFSATCKIHLVFPRSSEA